MLSIIYVVFAFAFTWQEEALLKTKTKQDVQHFTATKTLEGECNEAKQYLAYPKVCKDWIESLRKYKYMNHYQIQIVEAAFERACILKSSQQGSVEALLLQQQQIEKGKACYIYIEERIKDILYSQN